MEVVVFFLFFDASEGEREKAFEVEVEKKCSRRLRQHERPSGGRRSGYRDGDFAGKRKTTLVFYLLLSLSSLSERVDA